MNEHLLQNHVIRLAGFGNIRTGQYREQGPPLGKIRYHDPPKIVPDAGGQDDSTRPVLRGLGLALQPANP